MKELERALAEGAPDDSSTRQRIAEEVNMDAKLCRDLRRRGHRVFHFDCRNPDDRSSPLHDTPRLAGILAEAIINHNANAMILDLQFFNDFHAGVNVLKILVKDGCIPTDMMPKLFIYSNFLNDEELGYVAELCAVCKVPKQNLISRLQVNITQLIAKLEDA